MPHNECSKTTPIHAAGVVPVLVVVKVGYMRPLTEVSQIPHPQHSLLIPTSQDVAGHPVPRNDIHICVRGSHGEHAAAAFSCVPNSQAMVNRTGSKDIGLGWTPLQVLDGPSVPLVGLCDCPLGFWCWLPYMDGVAAVTAGELACCVGGPV